MKKLFSSDKLYVAKSPIPDAGRGVFARVAVKKGELIETCPVIEIPEHDASGLSEGILVTYFYFFGKHKERMLLVLGFGSLYNHTYTPNAKYKENIKDKTVEFYALRDIKEDEEVTVNYSQGNSKDADPLWF